MTTTKTTTTAVRRPPRSAEEVEEQFLEVVEALQKTSQALTPANQTFQSLVQAYVTMLTHLLDAVPPCKRSQYPRYDQLLLSQSDEATAAIPLARSPPRVQVLRAGGSDGRIAGAKPFGVDIDISDLHNGCRKLVKLTTTRVCSKCNGTRATASTSSPSAPPSPTTTTTTTTTTPPQEQTMMNQDNETQQQQQGTNKSGVQMELCEKCKGVGTIDGKMCDQCWCTGTRKVGCDACKGTGMQEGLPLLVKANVPKAHVPTQFPLTLFLESQIHVDFELFAQLKWHWGIFEAVHDSNTRTRTDLVARKTITRAQYLNGFEFRMLYLDRKVHRLTFPPQHHHHHHRQSGSSDTFCKWTVPGFGMCKNGDLTFEFDIVNDPALPPHLLLPTPTPAPVTVVASPSLSPQATATVQPMLPVTAAASQPRFTQSHPPPPPIFIPPTHTTTSSSLLLLSSPTTATLISTPPASPPRLARVPPRSVSLPLVTDAMKKRILALPAVSPTMLSSSSPCCSLESSLMNGPDTKRRKSADGSSSITTPTTTMTPTTPVQPPPPPSQMTATVPHMMNAVVPSCIALPIPPHWIQPLAVTAVAPAVVTSSTPSHQLMSSNSNRRSLTQTNGTNNMSGTPSNTTSMNSNNMSGTPSTNNSSSSNNTQLVGTCMIQQRQLTQRQLIAALLLLDNKEQAKTIHNLNQVLARSGACVPALLLMSMLLSSSSSSSTTADRKQSDEYRSKAQAASTDAQLFATEFFTSASSVLSSSPSFAALKTLFTQTSFTHHTTTIINHHHAITTN